MKTDKTYRIRPRSVRAIKEALLIGPIAVSVSTHSNAFKYYRKGIIDSKDCGRWSDHIVVAVGYGEEVRADKPPRPYIIIKNTWGTYWGEDGYARISLSQEHRAGGVCGILLWNYLATVKSVEPPTS